MRIGIITDIHSNIQALDAVLKEFDRRKVEKIICCGDIIGIGPNPEETVQMLIKRKHSLISVRGNHEKYLIEGLPREVHKDKRKMSPEEIKNHEWNHNKLSEESKNFIIELPETRSFEIENKKIHVVHYPCNEEGNYKKIIKRPTIADNQEMFKKIDADIFLYGHTHTISVNSNDDKWYINTGAVGCIIDNDMASAGILSINDEKVDFQCLSIEYDIKKTIEEINKIKFPMYKKILKIFYRRDMEEN